MAAFEYIAIDPIGEQQKGTMEADSSRQVRQQLRERAWTPLSVNPVAEGRESTPAGVSKFWIRGVSPIELATITRQLATLVQAAMPVEEALDGVAAQQEKRRLKNILLAIRSKVLEGFTLAQGLDEFPQIFPQMFRATVAAGEHSGHLDKVLNSLADYTESRMKSSQKVQQALLYPVILLIVAFGIVGFLLGYVVPDVVQVFVDTGQELPAITVALISASNGFQVLWPWLLLSVVVGWVVFVRALKKRSFRMAWDGFLLTVPLVGRFSRTLAAARFASTLSILTRSSVSLVEALLIAAQVIDNQVIREAVRETSRLVSEGGSLHRSLAESGYFPPLMLHMIASGEATGELEEMLDRAAQNQQLELDSRSATILGLFEPLMLVVMGGVVMLIVLAILLPILNMNQLLN